MNISNCNLSFQKLYRLKKEEDMRNFSTYRNQQGGYELSDNGDSFRGITAQSYDYFNKQTQELDEISEQNNCDVYISTSRNQCCDKCAPEGLNFFAFIRKKDMPEGVGFWYKLFGLDNKIPDYLNAQKGYTSDYPLNVEKGYDDNSKSMVDKFKKAIIEIMETGTYQPKKVNKDGMGMFRSVNGSKVQDSCDYYRTDAED